MDDPWTYVLVCRECEITIPFPSPTERGRWATEHTIGTGHERWTVIDARNEIEMGRRNEGRP